MSSESNSEKYFVIALRIGVVLSILAGVGIVIFYFSFMFKGDTESLSSMGEFFGGTVGTIWALAGVILFYLALIYQRRELELQRQELVESRKIQKEQSETISIQQFENTFFHLLGFHLEASKKIIEEKDNGFEKMYNDFKKSVSATKLKRKKDGSMQVLDEHAYETSFRNVYDGYKNTLAHYMSSYKALVFFVEDKSNEPRFYMSLIKPHLTEQEVLIQFYHLVLYRKDEKFKRAVEAYGLFERLNFRAIQEIDKFHLEDMANGAFQSLEIPLKKEE